MGLVCGDESLLLTLDPSPSPFSLSLSMFLLSSLPSDSGREEDFWVSPKRELARERRGEERGVVRGEERGESERNL